MAEARAMGEAAFRYVHSPAFAEILHRLGATLLVTTYQAGKLAVFRSRDGRLSMLPRTFDKAMGIAADRQRLAIGTTWQVWTLCNAPEVAARMSDAAYDACYIPRRSHVTGMIDVHEIAFARGGDDESEQLWVVNTLFSCLCTLQYPFSFVPRWRPHFVSRITRQDRCHLNGLAVVNGRPRYVTLFGRTDTPEGWRPGKVDGGCIIDIETDAVIADGLSMPHSPRMHEGRLWVLDSGRGRLCVVDPNNGHVETVTELAGYTRGLAFAGPFAFVGLSKVREKDVFAGVPVAEKTTERKCGVSVIEVASGRVVAFLEFQGDVAEIFDVQLVSSVRFPAVVGFNKETIQKACVIAEERPIGVQRDGTVATPDGATPDGATPAVNPEAAEAHDRGLALASSGDLPGAVEAYRRALKADPGLAAAHNHLANALVGLGDHDGAAATYREAVRHRPDDVKAHSNLGHLLLQMTDVEGALTACRKAVHLDPGYAPGHNHLGNALRRKGQTRDALAAYRNAIHAKKSYAPGHCNMGSTLLELEEPQQAVTCFRRAIEIDDSLVEAHRGLGQSLAAIGRHEEGVAALRRALHLSGGTLDLHTQLGNTLRIAGHVDEAVRHLEQTVVMDDARVEAHNDLALALQDQGQLDAAQEHFERALTLDDSNPVVRMNFGLLRLLRGDLETGWPAYESRLRAPKEGRTGAIGTTVRTDKRQFPHPHWDGTSPAGKSMLIWSEQGVGDEFMFAALVSELIDAGAHCIVECDRRAVPLLQRSLPEAECVARRDPPDRRIAQADIDVQCAMGNLARWRRPSLRGFAPLPSYLKVDAAVAERCRESHRRFGAGRKVGIAWRSGNPTHGPKRSAPLRLWDDLLTTLAPEVCWINLQYGDCREELAETTARTGVTIHDDRGIDPLTDLDSFAARVHALDLVISIDNSTVHIAGGLGKPVWTMLPAAPDWRWLPEGASSHWYPSMKLFRQKQLGAWDTVFKNVIDALKER